MSIGADAFVLDPDVAFLNHGSFGACPREVIEARQAYQQQLERQPVRFLQRELPDLLDAARAELAGFLGAGERDLVFVPNPTFAVNEIARSLRLGPGDRVLTTNHEYGACRNAWDFMAGRSGFAVDEVGLGPTIGSSSHFTETMWDAVQDTTRVLHISHITSPTALTFPIDDLCRRATEAGIIVVVDGAHVPGQLPLDLTALDVDFYTGACHKWLCAPKGASFLHAAPRAQHLLEPLVVGWGWGDSPQFDSGSEFLDHHEWLGTHDPSAYLAVPAAIAFQRVHEWAAVQERCHGEAVRAVAELAAIDGIDAVHHESRHRQMGLVEVDGRFGDPRGLQRWLYDEHRVEVPVIQWPDAEGAGRTFIRISIQAYNTADDVDRLVAAMGDASDRDLL